MKQVRLTLILIFLFSFEPKGKAQTMKDSFYVESIPTFDSLGNMYTVKKLFFHAPSFEDSMQFFKEAEIEVSKMFNEKFEKDRIEREASERRYLNAHKRAKRKKPQPLRKKH
jgi:hypothetical protein